ncbi:MAG TPA: hypothetical protein VJK52_04610, partial [Candidatus Nanoarchaeia archaeon]|nr:hypothetical protein [Candidatus Nanoarchaeia archaeon]
MTGFPSATPGSGPDYYLRTEAEKTRSSTDFTAQMIERAKSLDPNADTKLLTDDSLWRKEWKTLGIYNRARDPTVEPTTPENLLKIFDPNSRKGFLLQYLQERFPKAADTFPDFLLIKNYTPAQLDTADGIKAISSFMAMGEEMLNVHPAGLMANVANTGFAAQINLLKSVKEELKNLYRKGRGVTPRAFFDFAAAIDRDPEPRSVASSDPVNLWLILSNDPEEKNTFAAALNPKYNTLADPIFTDKHLTVMTRAYQRRKMETGRVALDAVQGIRKVHDKIDVAEKRSFATKVLENYSNLETWQKLVMFGAVAGLTYWTFFKKREKSGLVHYGAGALLAGSAFYLTGAREIFKGTVIDDVLTGVEKQSRELFAGIRSHYGPDLTNTEDLNQYAAFIQEMATEDVKNQVEAMGYISTIPLGKIATSFTLKNGAREGVLNLDRSSPLSREVQRLFGSTTQANKILSILKSNSADLSDAMAHAFYMIGAIEHKDDYREVEKARGAGRYDDIRDGTRGRELYERLAQEGVQLAESKYSEMSW